ncbi:MAG: phosphoglucosamine mutase [Oscillospiraceae bacterium]|nr:phosphoglucosamine mutase [Oscillospiraceae bacterium]
MSRFLRQEGLRGIAITEITCELMLRLGRAAAQAIGRTSNHPPVFYISHDPRRAAEALEAALCAGICAGGGIAHTLGVLPSSGLALMLSAEDAEAGIALSGGNLPYESVCVRLFAKSGLPMSSEQLDAISALMPSNAAMPLKSHQNCGYIARQDDASRRYLRLLAARLSTPTDLKQSKPLRIALDCANGAVSDLAEPLFRHLGAEVLLLNDHPDGMNINRDCGVQSMSQLIQFVKDYNCSAGFAFDGNGGRCLAVDESGELLDGDRMLAILCEEQLALQKDAPAGRPDVMQRGVAATVMSNLGFLRYAKSRGIPVQSTQPAPQFVLDKMRNLGLALGGDGSGYLYFADVPAPDGLMTAARLLQVMQRTGKPLGTLSNVMEYDPQVAVSVKIPQHWREIWKNDPDITGFISACEAELGTEGRILVRERRDDASIRIMLEGRDFRRINSYAFAIEEAIKSRTSAK